MSDEDAEDDPPRPDARQPRRLGVGAGRVDRPAGRQVAQRPGEGDEDDQRDRDDQPLPGRLAQRRTTGSSRGRSRTNSPSRTPAQRLAQDDQRRQRHHDRRQPSPATSTPLTAPMPRPGQRASPGRPAASAARPCASRPATTPQIAELRADRDVDLPAEDHQRHADRGHQHRGVADQRRRGAARAGRTAGRRHRQDEQEQRRRPRPPTARGDTARDS